MIARGKRWSLTFSVILSVFRTASRVGHRDWSCVNHLIGAEVLGWSVGGVSSWHHADQFRG